jgi:hypothetical protein
MNILKLVLDECSKENNQIHDGNNNWYWVLILNRHTEDNGVTLKLAPIKAEDLDEFDKNYFVHTYKSHENEFPILECKKPFKLEKE